MATWRSRTTIPDVVVKIYADGRGSGRYRVYIIGPTRNLIVDGGEHSPPFETWDEARDDAYEWAQVYREQGYRVVLKLHRPRAPQS